MECGGGEEGESFGTVVSSWRESFTLEQTNNQNDRRKNRRPGKFKIERQKNPYLSTIRSWPNDNEFPGKIDEKGGEGNKSVLRSLQTMRRTVGFRDFGRYRCCCFCL